jgi:hypothetical protein
MLEKITVHGDTVIVNPELSRLGDVSKPQDQMQENKNLLSSGTAENTYYKNKKTDSHNGWLRAIAETLPLKRKRLMISVIAFGICIIILAMIQ